MELDPLAYGFGALVLVVFLLVQGLIVGAILGAALATGGALVAAGCFGRRG
jgi:hypothetical protein